MILAELLQTSDSKFEKHHQKVDLCHVPPLPDSIKQDMPQKKNHSEITDLPIPFPKLCFET